MVKQCKYVEKNRKENKCPDNFISHREGGDKVMCRLSEWKKKQGVCPYDKSITSQQKKIQKLKDKGQKELI